MAKNSNTDDFYEEQTEKSAIKSAIVAEFFKVYLRIIDNKFKRDIFYIDLFSGPGMYKDHSKSTPLYIMDSLGAYFDPSILYRFHCVFNESNKNFHSQLQENIQNHDIYSKLKYKPVITNKSADEIDLSNYLTGNNPVFSFIDPFGYKSNTAKQIWDLVHSIGSDCIFFFNANRIIVDFNKSNKDQDFKDLFGNRYNDLSQRINLCNSHHEKMKAVLDAFSLNLLDIVRKESYKFCLFILPFGFAFDDREKESHYLLFITKNHKAVCEMKNVMAKLATSISDIYSFDSKKVNQLSFFNIKNDGYANFKGTIKVFIQSILDREWSLKTLLTTIDKLSMSKFHKVTPFKTKDMKVFLRKFYEEGHITTEKPFSKQEIFSDTRIFKIKDV